MNLETNSLLSGQEEYNTLIMLDNELLFKISMSIFAIEYIYEQLSGKAGAYGQFFYFHLFFSPK